jgi:hypothetical protein
MLKLKKNKIKFGDLYTQPFWAALGLRVECFTRVTQQTGQANSMSAQVLLPLAVNSKSELKVNSLPPLGFEPAIYGMLAHLNKKKKNFKEKKSHHPCSTCHR